MKVKAKGLVGATWRAAGPPGLFSRLGAAVSPDSDARLLDGCKAGDPASWNRLYDRYQRMVHSIPLNYGLSDPDAADVTQAVFTALIQSLDQLRDAGGLRHWLATVARRETWRMLAYRRREPLTDEIEVPIELDGASERESAHGLERWELVEWISAGLEQLRPKCRDLLVALYFRTDSPSYGEIAESLHMPLGSIGPTRARCLASLRSALAAIGLPSSRL